MESKSKQSYNSRVPCDHDEEDERLIEVSKRQIRLSRLYGSKSKNLKKGRRKDCNSKYCGNSNLKKDDDSIQRKRSQKFFERKRDESTVEIHADNYKIAHPWFVGYKNTISLQGSPLALASR